MSVLEEPAAVAAAPVPPLRRNRDFLLLWSGAAMSLLGTRVTSLAYPLLVLWTTESPLAMSLVAFAALLPTLLVQLPAGVLVDRWDRRRLMVACEAGRAAALATVAAAVLAGHVWIAHIAVVAFVESSLFIVYRLAERGAVRNVVHPEHLATALAQNEARGRAAGLLGQPGGILLQSLARSAPFLFAAVAYLGSLCSLLLIRSKFQAEKAEITDGTPPAPGVHGMRAEIGEGVRWLWHQPFLRAALALVAGSNVLFQIIGLALILLVKEEGRPESTLAVIVVIGGIGGMLGALTGGWWMRRLSGRAILTGGVAVWAVLMTAMAFTGGNPFLLGALFAGTGLVGAVFNVAASVYQVHTTPDELQGRVAAVTGLVGSGTNALGALIGGVALAAWGASRSILLTGAAMGVLALAAVLMPSLRTGIQLPGRTEIESGDTAGSTPENVNKNEHENEHENATQGAAR
ncbi:MFS transporter [Streptomyces sp. NPDC054932]